MKRISKKIITEFEIIDSIIGLIGVIIVIGAALYLQLFYGEQPCPLCLLQRVAFINIGIALLMNVRYGNKVSHWAIAIISACSGMAVSLRQISLHVNNPIGFGSPVLGLHLYTWCFIGFFITIMGSGIMLLIYPEVLD